jgi:hypothetical protein
VKDATGQSFADAHVSDQIGEAWPDLLLQPGSPHCTPCTTLRRLGGWDTVQAYGRGLQIDTDIVLASPFQNSCDSWLWTPYTSLSRSLPLTATPNGPHGVMERTCTRIPPCVFQSDCDVRFGSLADILTSPRHVRFTPTHSGQKTDEMVFTDATRGLGA